jgi:thioredoxin
MKKIAAFFSCIFLLIGCQGQTAKGVEKLLPAAYSGKIKSTPNAQIIDVRTPEEFDGEHIPNAININWNGDDFEAKVSKFDKSKPVFVYCKVGGRSRQAANKFSEMGFVKVYDLDGGILKWTAEGYGEKTDRIIGMCSQEYGEMLKADKPILVDFYAKWCEPCKKMAPYLDKLTTEMKDKVTIIRLDADEHKTLVSEMKIDSLPSLILYKNGKIIWQHKGFISEDELKKQL